MENGKCMCSPIDCANNFNVEGGGVFNDQQQILQHSTVTLMPHWRLWCGFSGHI